MSDHPTPRSEHSPEYLAYLGSPEWAAFRIRFFRFHLKACVACGYTRNVQLHHRTYERLGQEHLEDVVPLCGKCHEKVHAYRKEKRVSLWEATTRITKRRDQRKKKSWPYRKRKSPGTRGGPLKKTVRLEAIIAAKSRLAKAETIREQIRFHQAEKFLKS